MINVVKGKKIVPTADIFEGTTLEYVLYDLGCGDGKQVYDVARNFPDYFCIGIDANFKGLEEASRKATRKAAKGGLTNLIYVHSPIEFLPKSIDETADEIQISFPWGSLLEGIVKCDENIINPIVRLAKDNCRLIIWLTYDSKFEGEYKEQRNLPELSVEYIRETLAKQFGEYGIKLQEARLLEEDEIGKINSPWGKKINANRKRDVYQIQCIIYKATSE